MTLTTKVVSAVALALAGLACSSDEDNTPKDTTIKAAWVFVGPPGDLGWTYAHNQGRLDVEANLEGVETSYVENVKEEDAEAAMQALVDKGNRIVFTTSFGYMDATLAAAGKNPTAFFEHCSGYKTATNLSNYFGRMHQALYLAGMVAGRVSKTKKIAIAAAWPIPEVIRHINALTLGVKSVLPDAEVHVEWLMSWYDPPKEEMLATKLIDGGADIIIQGSDSTASIFAAKDKGVFAVGYDSDVLSFAPNHVLTSAIWNWGPYYTARVKAAKDGSWASHSYWGPISDGIVKLGKFGDMVSKEVQDEVAAKRKLIEDKSFDVFQGPLLKQDGSTWIEQGKALTDQELLAMREFVKGVVGDIPETCDICGP
jgi:basic membrane protein A